MGSSIPRDGRVLVVDDEPGLRDMLSILFRREGFDVECAPGFAVAERALTNTPVPYGLVLTDVMMPDGSGLDLLSLSKKRSPDTEVVVMTAHSTIELAIEAMRRGAYDFVAKPFGAAELRAIAQKAFERRAVGGKRASPSVERDLGLLGYSEPMKRILDLIARVGRTKSTVLITGESGVGKERVARAIHQMSDRADKPLLVVDCGAIPEALIESELFGHDKGAFTGAISRHLGIFREADGGTVFLDEVGELPISMQVKLLRVLQERKVRGVGSTTETSVDVRVIAATNRNVEDDVRTGKFRQDLYYRLNVIRVEVPPLRERREDIVQFANHFLRRCAAEHAKDIRSFSANAVRALEMYSFPGNVRELENAIERAVALSNGTAIDLCDLPRELHNAATTAPPASSLVCLPEDECDLEAILGDVERRLILQALERSGGVRTQAARLLGVTLRSLRYRLQKHALDTDERGVDGVDSTPSSDGRDSSAARESR